MSKSHVKKSITMITAILKKFVRYADGAKKKSGEKECQDLLRQISYPGEPVATNKEIRDEMRMLKKKEDLTEKEELYLYELRLEYGRRMIRLKIFMDNKEKEE